MIRQLAGLTALALVAGCPERGRLTGPTNGIGIGPAVSIDNPAQDVTMTAGSAMLIGGTAFDEEGVDSVYFTALDRPGETATIAAGGHPRASFSFVLNLVGNPGDTITVWVYAANLNQVRGDPVSRRIRLR